MMRIAGSCFSAIFLVLTGFCSVAVAQQNEQIKSLIRDASKECRTAKLLRRDDLTEAQKHFKEYVRILNEAIAIQPDLLSSADPGIKRVLDFCNVVKNDLDRAEALPLFERGISECGEARVLISNAAFDDAREKYQRYRQYKEGALAISLSVLDVYENSYEIRLCDRLEQDITQAEQEYRRQLELAATEAKSSFQSVVEGLSQADRQCRGAQNLINDKDYSAQTVTQIQSLATAAENLKQGALAERKQLLAQGNSLDNPTGKKIDSLLLGLDECLASIPGGITRVQATVAARSQGGAGGGRAASTANSALRQIVGAPANYPLRALRRNIEGFVTVKFTVTKTGDVTNIVIVEAEPKNVFEDSVINAVEKYKYQPRVVNGEPVDTKDVEKKVIFKLQ